MRTEEWVEENRHGPYLFKCPFCGSTRIRKIINYSYYGPPSDLSVCAGCGRSNWTIVKEDRKVKS